MGSMRYALVLFAVLAVAGCASVPDYSEYHFKSVNELIAVVERAGWSCVDSTKDEAATANDLAQYGYANEACSNGSVTIVSSDAKRAQLDANPGNALRSGECRLDGGNWSVWGQQYLVEDAQKVMQGSLTCS